MLRITPCQRMVSDRFPVASFVVNVPGDRVFEIACATDPSLFRADHRNRRSPENFFTSRGGGLLRAPAGQATYLLPPEQLRRFAGRSRLYYALGAYDARGTGAQFSLPLEQVEQAPCIQIAGDFTGRSLDRRRVQRPSQDPRYGASAEVLSWGGDLAPQAAYGARPAQAPAAHDYDDGYPRELWTGSQARGDRGLEGGPEMLEAREPGGAEDAPGLQASESGPGTNPAIWRARATTPTAGWPARTYGDGAVAEASCTEGPRHLRGPPEEEAPAAALRRAFIRARLWLAGSARYGAPAPRAAARRPPGAEDSAGATRGCRGRATLRRGHRRPPAAAAFPPPPAMAATGAVAGKDDAYDDGDDDGAAQLPARARRRAGPLRLRAARPHHPQEAGHRPPRHRLRGAERRSATRR